MKVVGLIAEYNPFHYGHKYHIEEAKKITGADYVIVVMSGNFVQRGAPAIIDKYSRVAMAINNGADIVFELPECYATGSAEFFALGSISLLDKLGIVDFICFGSEEGDIDLLKEAAHLLYHTPPSYEEALSSYMKNGLTYPSARARAAEEYLSQNGSKNADSITRLLKEPNNILGVEYIKALYNISSSIIPITIKRQTSHYNDTCLNNITYDKSSNVISSATAIRKALLKSMNPNELSIIEASVPRNVYKILSSKFKKTYPICESDFLPIIKYKILSEDKETLMDYVDINADLANRLKNIRDLDLNTNDLINSLKTRNMTQTRITRCLTHLILNITNKELLSYNKNGYTAYARLLGMKKSASHLIKEIKKIDDIPVITSLAESQRHLDHLAKSMLSMDIFSTHLYNQTVYNKFGISIPNEYKHGLCLY